HAGPQDPISFNVRKSIPSRARRGLAIPEILAVAPGYMLADDQLAPLISRTAGSCPFWRGTFTRTFSRARCLFGQRSAQARLSRDIAIGILRAPDILWPCLRTGPAAPFSAEQVAVECGCGEGE